MRSVARLLRSRRDRQRTIGRRFRAGTAIAALSLLGSACAPPAIKRDVAVFFPPAPQLARVQYLTSFSGLRDIEEQSSFNRFVVGEKQDLKLDKPYGVGIHDGKIYVCDTNSTVIVFDFKSKQFGSLKGAFGAGKLVQPINISITPDGTKYVADPVRGQVVAFGGDDEFLTAYGAAGNWRPVDAAPFGDYLYVVDAANRRIEVFDLTSGKSVRTIGDTGEPSERLDRPTNVAFDRDGILYVTDASRFQVLRYDRDGHFKGEIGKPGDNLGHFARPKGIALDRDGNVFVVDASFNNVQVFNRDGRLLMFFGEGGENPGNFMLPAKVAIDYDNVSYFRQYVQPGFEVDYLVLVTSQFGPRMVNVFAYGKEKGKRYPSNEELLKQIEERRKKELEKMPKPPAATPESEPKQEPPG